MKRKPICVKEYEVRPVFYERVSFLRLYNSEVNVLKKKVQYEIPEKYKDLDLVGIPENLIDEGRTIHDKAAAAIAKIVGDNMSKSGALPGFFQLQIDYVVLNCKFYCLEVQPKSEELYARYECHSCIPVPNYEYPVYIFID